jgi:hypothetical protein
VRSPRPWWLGLAVTTGVEVSRATLAATQRGISAAFTVQGDTPGESRNLTLTATGTLALSATTVTVPIVATTGVRAGGFAAYAGGGVDLISGSSTLTAGLTGDLATTSDKVDVGTLAITAAGTASVTTASLRGLVGFSVDVWHVNVYTQGDISQTASAITLGLRGTM